MEIELFYTPRTRASRVRWLLEELDLHYTLRPVDLYRGERNPAHPLGMVPAMRVDGEPMFESGAMCMWLAARTHRAVPAITGLYRAPGHARCLQALKETQNR